LGETQAAESDVERALELAEPDGLIWPFVVTPARALLERHPRHRSAHGGLLKGILDVLAGSPPPAQAGQPAAPREDLSEGELRVLRYLPSNLSAPEIGRELTFPSTRSRRACGAPTKLGVHRRRGGRLTFPGATPALDVSASEPAGRRRLAPG